MPRRYLRRISRQYRQNHGAWYLRPFAPLLGHPMYFALNRRSVTRALAIGVFISMLPLPAHTLLAVLIALAAGVNLGVAALGAWANTPFTMIPVYWFEYRLGAWLLDHPAQQWPDEVSFDWLQGQIAQIWQPLYLGAVLTATTVTALVYLAINALWHRSAVRRRGRRPSTP